MGLQQLMEAQLRMNSLGNSNHQVQTVSTNTTTIEPKKTNQLDVEKPSKIRRKPIPRDEPVSAIYVGGLANMDEESESEDDYQEEVSKVFSTITEEKNNTKVETNWKFNEDEIDTCKPVELDFYPEKSEESDNGEDPSSCFVQGEPSPKLMLTSSVLESKDDEESPSMVVMEGDTTFGIPRIGTIISNDSESDEDDGDDDDDEDEWLAAVEAKYLNQKL